MWEKKKSAIPLRYAPTFSVYQKSRQMSIAFGKIKLGKILSGTLDLLGKSWYNVTVKISKKEVIPMASFIPSERDLHKR